MESSLHSAKKSSSVQNFPVHCAPSKRYDMVLYSRELTEEVGTPETEPETRIPQSLFYSRISICCVTEPLWDLGPVVGFG